MSTENKHNRNRSSRRSRSHNCQSGTDRTCSSDAACQQLSEKGFLMRKTELNFSELCAFVTKVFGASEYSTLIEPNICLIARRLSPQYCCGSWTHYKTRAGAFLMIPDADAMILVKSPNGRERVMSADAFGVVACRFAYSHLSFQLIYAGYVELAAVVKEQLFLLNDYLDGHKEANAIYEICD